MLGRRWKRIVNLRNRPDCPAYLGFPDSSESSGSSDMPPRADRPVVEEAPTRILGPGDILGRDDESWTESNYYFVQCPHEPQPLVYYYRDLSMAYGGPDGTEGREPDSRERMDKFFSEAPGTRCVLLCTQK